MVHIFTVGQGNFYWPALLIYGQVRLNEGAKLCFTIGACDMAAVCYGGGAVDDDAVIAFNRAHTKAHFWALNWAEGFDVFCVQCGGFRARVYFGVNGV